VGTASPRVRTEKALLLHIIVVKSAITVHCRQEDEMVR